MPYFMQISDKFFHDPSNLTCFDCNIARPTTLDLMYGVFICDSCSRQHIDQQAIRQLGAAELTSDEAEVMSRGGNATYREFLGEYDLALTFEVKYQSNAAHFYRCRIAGMELPDYQLEKFSLPYEPKPKGWLSSIYDTAGTVINFTSGVGSKLASAVSNSFPSDTNILSTVAETSAGIISSVSEAASSAAGAASTVAYYAIGQIRGQPDEEHKNKVEYIRMKTIKAPAVEPIPEEGALTMSQCIIERGDSAPPADSFGNIQSDEEDIEPSAPEMRYSCSSSGEFRGSAEQLYPNLAQ